MSDQIFASPVPRVVAGFTTRRGGVSKSPFDSLNLAVSTGDEPELVERNRELLLRAVGFESGRLAIAGQIHGTNVAYVSGAGLVRDTDALITETPGLLLGMVAADCAIVLVAEAGGSVVGAAHAGWRGAAGGIVANLVEGMKARGCSVAELLAYVSPCISREHFEVGPEVARQFDQRFVSVNAETGKDHVDLTGVLRDQLERTGLEAARIRIDGRCTYDNPDLYYSYRAQQGVTGRMMGYIGIQK